MVLRVECLLCSGQIMPETTGKVYTAGVWNEAED